MASKSGSKKKSGSRRSGDAGVKDRLIDELKNRVTVLENELRLAHDPNSPDIAERMRAEEARRESEEKFRIMANSSRAGIIVIQGEKIVYINQALADMGGHTVEECLDKNFLDFVHPDFRELLRQRGYAAQHEGKIIQPRYEVKIIRKYGGVRWLDFSPGLITYNGVPALIVTAIDITEHKRAEERLERSEKLYRTLAEAAHDLIFIIGRDDKVKYINSFAANAFGKRPEDIIGMLRKDLFPRKISERQEMNLAAVFETGEPALVEDTVILGDKEIWVSTWLVPIRGDGGRVEAVMGISRDISGRKRAEEALRESEEMFRALAESVNAGIVLIRGDKFIYVNPVTIKDLGYSKDELLAMNYWDVIHPDSRELVRSRALRRLQGLPEPYTYEIKVLTKGGETLWEQLSSIVIDYNGEPTILSTIFNITDRKRAEDALVREKFILTKSQEAAHVGNWAYDLQTREVTGSDEVYRIFGFKPGEFKLSRDWIRSHVLPEDLAEMDNFMSARVRDGMYGSVDYRIKRRDGSTRYLNTIVDKSVRDKAGRITRLYGIIQDVTERKRAEEEMKAAKQQAELYLDLMSHDINNLHQAALGYLELARDMPPGEEQAKLLDKPVEVLQRSTQLISNVRKLEKLRNGAFLSQDIDVCKVLFDVQREYSMVPNKTVSLNLNGREHCFVQANELLHEVFANLVGNAIKHTGDRTDIIVDLDILKDSGITYCRVAVEDDGPGIPDGFKATIFNRALKGTAKARGMGLGLYLVKSLVDSYGGRVWVEDRIRGDHTKGARFVVMLPAVEK
jgi:PAS domain S-box-containing protein